MKKARIRVRQNCGRSWYDFGVYSGRTSLWFTNKVWRTKEAAIRNAKAMAKSLDIKYDPEMVIEHGC